MGSMLMLIALYIIIMLAMFLPMYLIQKRKNKKFKQLLDNIKIGSKIVTTGGIYGRVHKINEDTILLNVDKNINLEISKGSISRIVD